MGTWNAEIYGNDIAMDTICNLEKNFKKHGVEKAIELCRLDGYYKYTECKLAIAYVELTFTGTITNKTDILNVIKQELSDQVINDWVPEYREKRIEILQDLKNEITNPNKNNIFMKEDISHWFLERHRGDIFFIKSQ